MNDGSGGACLKGADVREVTRGEKELPVGLQCEPRRESIRRAQHGADALRGELPEDILIRRVSGGDVARLTERVQDGGKELEVELGRGSKEHPEGPREVETVRQQLRCCLCAKGQGSRRIGRELEL